MSQPAGAVARRRARLRCGDLGARSRSPRPRATAPQDHAFWLYSSGSTGKPKGTVHTHANPWWTAELYGKPVLGLTENDVCFSAAKLYFAYGLGNALTFPLSVGATVVLMAERPTPDAIFKRWTGAHKPTVFFGAPTGFAGMLASPDCPRATRRAAHVLLGRRGAAGRDRAALQARFGCEIIDGIGSTEMLHIFLSNRPGDIRYGTTGKPVAGYEIELRGEDGRPVADGEVGDLYIKGPSAALMYWGNREKSARTFQRRLDQERRQVLARRRRLLHLRRPQRRHAEGERHVRLAVRGRGDADAASGGARGGGDRQGGRRRADQDQGLRRAARPASRSSDAELKAFVKERLAPYKYPRLIEFVDELPKTATGKIQRFRLREREQQA